MEINTKDCYDFISSYYDEVFYSEFNEENLIISLIIDYFIKTKNPKIVSEFGTGSGYWLKNFLENNVENIFAFDCSEKMLNICKIKFKDTNISFKNIDFTNTSLLIKNDLILTAFFFDAIDIKHFEGVIFGIKSSLNDGGIFIFVDNVPTDSKDFQELILSENWAGKNINCKYNLYSFEFLIETFKKFNFDIIFKVKIGFDIQILVCKK